MSLTGLFSPNIDKLKAKGDVRGLIKALEHPKDEIQMRVAKALGEIGDEQASESLEELFRTSDERWVRSAALSALGDLQGSGNINIMDYRMILEKGLHDKQCLYESRQLRRLLNLSTKLALCICSPKHWVTKK